MTALAKLLATHMMSPPLFHRDSVPIGPLDDFPPADLQSTPDTPL
jgi:hypothetical protein